MLDYKSVSLANQVYERIEANILNGVYTPGEIISENKLSADLGVSRTPIREALARLEADRLIGDSPSGTVVLGISAADVKDMFTVKRKLEPMVIGLAAANISDWGLMQLKDILDQQEFYAGKGNAEKVRNLDTQFHDMIYAECGSTVYQHILSPLHHKLAKYRQNSLEHDDRIFCSVAEHKAIVEAMEARDAEKAEMLMARHLEKACDNMEKYSSEIQNRK